MTHRTCRITKSGRLCLTWESCSFCRYAKYHANQGFILFLAEAVVVIANAILGKIPLLGRILPALLSLAILALIIIGILNAANGKAKQLPLIGNLLHVFDK